MRTGVISLSRLPDCTTFSALFPFWFGSVFPCCLYMIAHAPPSHFALSGLRCMTGRHDWQQDTQNVLPSLREHHQTFSLLRYIYLILTWFGVGLGIFLQSVICPKEVSRGSPIHYFYIRYYKAPTPFPRNKDSHSSGRYRLIT